MEIEIIIGVIVLGIIIAASAITIRENASKQNRPTDGMERVKFETELLFSKYERDYSMEDLELYCEIKTTIENCIMDEIKAQKEENPEIFENFFRLVNYNQWLPQKCEEILYSMNLLDLIVTDSRMKQLKEFQDFLNDYKNRR